MTTYAFLDPLTEIPAAAPFTGPDGRQYPAGWPALASADDRAAAGMAAIAETAPPAGTRVTGRGVEMVNGVPTRTWATTAIAKADLAATACLAVDAERDRRIDGGFTHGGRPYQTRPSDRENIAGAAQAAFMAKAAGAQAGNLRWHGGASDFVWITADNQLATMDVDQVIALFSAGVAFKSALTFAARAKKDWLLAGARTRAEILAFDPAADWPV